MINQDACLNMVKQQLRTGDVLSDNILALYETLPRHDFVPQNAIDFAYSDLQIPLPHEQRMMTPLEEGRLLQALSLSGGEKVLEIGTGSGFLTALLSRLSKQVISLEYYEDLSRAAGLNLARHQCNNVELIHGDGCNGWLAAAPFDIIVMTSAVTFVPESLKLQVAAGGKLFAILGKAPAMRAMLYSVDHNDQWTETLLFNTNLPNLITPVQPNSFTFQDR